MSTGKKKKHKKSVPELLKPKIDAVIASHGRYLQGVFPTGDNPQGASFIYTIGNHLKNLPEFLCIGRFAPNAMAEGLNVISALQEHHGKPFAEGALIDLGGQVPVKVRKCTDAVKSEFTIQAGQYFKSEDYEVYQMLIPDIDGLYPDDPQCHPSFKVVLP
jgi:hypothetical protein